MKSTTKLKDEARKHEQKEEWEKAIKVYLQVLEAGDDAEGGEVELPLFNRVGDLYVRLNRPGDAVQYYEQAADRYADAGLYNNAIALCNKALRYMPGHVELLRKLAQFSASQGFLTDARRYFLEYAEKKFASGETDAGLKALEDFADVVDDAEVRELVGRKLLQYNHGREAVTELKKAYAMRLGAREDAEARALRSEILQIDAAAFADEGEAGTAPLTPHVHHGVQAAEALPGLADIGLAEISEPEPAAPVAEPVSAPEAELSDFAIHLPGEEPAAEAESGLLEGFESTSFESQEASAFALPDLEAGHGLDEGGDGLATIEVSGLDRPQQETPDALESLETTGFEDSTGPLAELPGLEEEAPGSFDLPLLGEEEEEAEALPTMDFGGEPAEALPGLEGGLEDISLPGLEEAEEAAEPLPLMHPDEPLPSLEDFSIDTGAAEAEAALEPLPGWEEPTEAEAEPEEEPLAPLPGLEEPAAEPVSEQIIEIEPESVRAEPEPAAPPTPLEAAPPSPEVPAIAAEAAAPPVGDVASGMGWDPSSLGPAPPAPPKPAPPKKAPPAGGFIDLGSLIAEDDEQEDDTRFVVEEKAPTGDEDRDFAELLSQFKQKVAENVSAEDAAAHYDLGLAFKEMGLVDEAISEFQIALRAGDMRLKVYEELGQCFLEKQQYNIAEKVLLRAMESKYQDELELLGVYYHLGRAYEGLGKRDQARDAYERVLALDINFGDVSERLSRL